MSITQADNECRLEGDKTHEIFHFLSKKVGGDISYVVPTKLKSGGGRVPPPSPTDLRPCDPWYTTAEQRPSRLQSNVALSISTLFASFNMMDRARHSRQFVQMLTNMFWLPGSRMEYSWRMRTIHLRYYLRLLRIAASTGVELRHHSLRNSPK